MALAVVNDLADNPIRHRAHPRLSALPASIIDPRLNACTSAGPATCAARFAWQFCRHCAERCLAEGRVDHLSCCGA